MNYLELVHEAQNLLQRDLTFEELAELANAGTLEPIKELLAEQQARWGEPQTVEENPGDLRE